MEDDLQRESTQGEVLDELASLRAQSLDDAAEIARLQSEAQESHRIERAQRALIAHLRHDVSEADERLEQVRDRLAGAESELDDLRAIRDALSSPALLQRADLTLAADLIPASSHVGGDFFFVGDGPGGAVVAIIGDVVGHGLPAARRAAFARTAFASLTPFSDDPCRLLQLVNVALVERIGESADFVTAACVTYHPSSRTLRAAAAGHPPPLRLDSGSELMIPFTGRALGLDDKVGGTAVTEQLSPGGGVLLYTDGLIEARGESFRYGIERAVEVLRSNRRHAHGRHLAPHPRRAGVRGPATRRRHLPDGVPRPRLKGRKAARDSGTFLPPKCVKTIPEPLEGQEFEDSRASSYLFLRSRSQRGSTHVDPAHAQRTPAPSLAARGRARVLIRTPGLRQQPDHEPGEGGRALRRARESRAPPPARPWPTQRPR